MDEPFADLRTLEDVRRFVDGTYQPSVPLTGDEAGQLMARAVTVAGSRGLTRAELEQLFAGLGQARFARGVATLQTTPGIVQVREPRPNAGGLYQWQVVFRRH